MKVAVTEAPQSGLRIEGAGQPLAPEDFTIFVYLCSGEVDMVRPATSVRLTVETMDVVLGDLVVARYARRDVYSASPCGTCSPSLS
jgi:hypothetical protein